HKERTYSLDMYQKMLTEVGFKVEVFADFMDDEPMETSKRWFFVCQK
ncbi:MAG: SAM-dependent methyltransferase, partial [Enterococcus hulanensis]